MTSHPDPIDDIFDPEPEEPEVYDEPEELDDDLDDDDGEPLPDDFDLEND